MTTSTATWPPKAGLSTPSIHRRNAVLPIIASTSIQAPASLVWTVLLDTTDWQEWNTFVPRVRIKPQPDGVGPESSKILHVGTTMVFDVVMDPTKPGKITATDLKVVDVSTPWEQSDYVPQELMTGDHGFTQDLSLLYRVSWKPDGGYPGLESERIHEIIIMGEETCEVRTWEIFGGLLAWTVKWMYGKALRDRFEDWCRDLKNRCEQVYQAQKTGAT